MSWISINPADSSQITTTLTKELFLEQLALVQPIAVQLKAIDQTDASLFNEDVTVEITFDRQAVIDTECRASIIQDPDPAITTQTIELMTSATATSLILTELQDSGTSSL